MTTIHQRLVTYLIDHEYPHGDVDKMAAAIIGMVSESKMDPHYVAELQAAHERLRLAFHTLEAKCAEMREALEKVKSELYSNLHPEQFQYELSIIKHALSSDCGEHHVHVRELERTRAFVRDVYEWCVTDNPSDIDGDCAKAELDHIEALMKGSQ